MASRDELNALRRQAWDLTQRATRKVAYNRREKGINLAGSDFDSRASKQKLSKYTQTQLRNYIKQQSDFVSRKTSFIKLNNGDIISSSQWREFQNNQKRASQRAKRRERRMNVHVPSLGAPAVEYEEYVLGSRRRLRQRRPVRQWGFRPENIESAKAFDKLSRLVERELNPKRTRKTVEKQKRQAMRIANNIGRLDIRSALGELSYEQFDFLWNYTQFARNLFEDPNASPKDRAAIDDAEDVRGALQDELLENVQEAGTLTSADFRSAATRKSRRR